MRVAVAPLGKAACREEGENGPAGEGVGGVE